LNKVGVLRGASLNPYEGQYFEKLKNYDFLPVGITTYDNKSDLSEIHFPIRMGYTLNALTKGVHKYFSRVVSKIVKYDLNAYSSLIWNLNKLVKDLDILHSADIWYPYTYQAVRTKIPTVITEWENIPFNFEVLPYIKMKKYVREHAAHFIAITEKAKKALTIEGVNPSRISVVPAGIDCERFKPTKKEEEIIEQFRVPKDTMNILFVGRLVPWKGIFDLLYAFSRLSRSFRNVLLIIVGSGPPRIRRQIDRLIVSLEIKDKVRFLGTIKYSFMPKIHSLADVFCLPSVAIKGWEEQFGYAIVEAMACGKPVVSTLTGSIPEVVIDDVTGILVNPNDPYALQKALEELILNEKKRKKLGKNARQWVLRKFEAKKIAKQLADIYRNFI